MGASQSQQTSGPSSRSRLPPGPNPLYQNAHKIEALAKALDVKAARQKQLIVQQDWERVEQDKQSLKILKSLFKKLDPTVVKSPNDVNGEIELSFKYDTKRQLLLVKIIRCRDLCAKDIRTKASDPYVKIQLYPDLHSHGAKMTQIVAGTRHPDFNEIFAFKMREKELPNTKLVAQVYDYDSVTDDDFLGEVVVDLTQFDFNKEPVLTAWYTLCMETDLSITGHLEVSLNFIQPNSLYLTIHQASGLSLRQDGKPAHALVKAAIPGTGIICKTGVQVNGIEPEWQETLEFEIQEEELAFRYIVVHVIDSHTFAENGTLGQIILDLDTLDLEKGFRGNLKLADLRNSERLRNKNQQHSVAQEFRESFRAHASARYPSFLFGQQSGKRSVTVTCMKAGASGKIHILDGIPVY